MVRDRVQALRRGHNEDDRFEFKSDWPTVDKARQLAASANRLAGEPLFYVIGVDERSGRAVQPSPVEAGEWLARLSKQFDQPPPRLDMHRVVQLDETDFATALVFSTEDVPYVVKTDSGNRDVPMRSGATTRSAHRYELVDMLAANVQVPPMSIAEATVRATLHTEPANSGPRLELVCVMRVFVGYVGDSAVTLPARGIKMRLRDDSSRLIANLPTSLGSGPSFYWPGMEHAPSPPPPPRFGVYIREDYVVATAPGEFALRADFEQAFTSSVGNVEIGRLRDSDTLSIDVALRVAMANRDVHLSQELHRTELLGREESDPYVDERATQRSLGAWSIRDASADPWSAD